MADIKNILKEENEFNRNILARLYTESQITFDNKSIIFDLKKFDKITKDFENRLDKVKEKIKTL